LSKSALVVLCGIQDKTKTTAEYLLFCRALLQKRPVILRSLRIVVFCKPDKTTGAATMKWLRLLGSSKSWVSFAEEPYKRDDVLQLESCCVVYQSTPLEQQLWGGYD